MRLQPQSNPSQTPSLSPSLSNRPIMTLNLRLKASSSLKLLLSPSAPKFWPQIHLMLCYSLRLKASLSLNLMSASAPKFCCQIHLTLCYSLRLKASLSLNLMSASALKLSPPIHLTLSHSLNSTACQKLPVWLWPLVPYHTDSSSPSCGPALGPSLSSQLLLSLSLLANLSMSPNVRPAVHLGSGLNPNHILLSTTAKASSFCLLKRSCIVSAW